MCTNPRTLRLRPTENGSLAWRYGVGYQRNNEVVVPCGKCAECLKKRQNDIMCRCYAQGKEAKSMHFITMTYKEEELPIAQTIYKVDKETGEITRISDPELLPDEKVDYPRYLVTHCEVSPRIVDVPCYLDSEKQPQTKIPGSIASLLEDLSDEAYFVRFTASLNSRDPRLAIKRFRTTWGRSHPDDPLDFKYYLCGEYGQKNTRRPHYHMLTFGLTDDQVNALAAEWHYGDILVEKCNETNNDGSNGYANVSRYVGKYSAKGMFNNPAYLSGCVPRSRCSASRGFGVDTLSDEAIKRYLALDVYDYDPNDVLALKRDPRLPKILETIKSRMVYNIDYTNYQKDKERKIVPFPLPKSFQRKIFNYSRKYGYDSYSAIRYFYTDFVRDSASEHSVEEFKEFCSDYSSEDYSLACIEYEKCKKIELQNREQAAKASHIQFYQKSIY